MIVFRLRAVFAQPDLDWFDWTWICRVLFFE